MVAQHVSEKNPTLSRMDSHSEYVYTTDLSRRAIEPASKLRRGGKRTEASRFRRHIHLDKIRRVKSELLEPVHGQVNVRGGMIRWAAVSLNWPAHEHEVKR